MQRFLQFRLDGRSLLLLDVLLAQLMLLGLTGCARLAMVVLWGMRCTCFLSVMPLLLCILGTQACSHLYRQH